MKKGLISFVLLTSVLSIFLLSVILAAAPASGKCAIVPRASCLSTNILMGVSDATNAHGEFPDTGLYPYVLCCAFGTGNTTCSDTNTLLKLSSTTNAHAEIPTGTNYNTNICYEDLQCIGVQNACPADHALEVASLVSSTNSHIGNFSDYSTKICCSSPLYAGCTITNATWNLQNAIAGQRVYLRVNGTGACVGKTITFKVFRTDGDSNSIQIQPVNISFSGVSAIGLWTAEWQKGVFGGNTNYYFNVSLAKNPLVSKKSDSPDLSVAKQSADFCGNINLCSDYKNQLDCQSDACQAAASSSLPEVNCNDPSNVCGCTWDKGSGSCKFGWNTITDCGSVATGGCKYGCTLCHNQTSGVTYCGIGSSCSPNIAATNSNGTCDFGIDGCSSSDCKEGEQDSCATGTYCSAGKCSSVEGPPLTLGSCKIVEKIEKTCDQEPVGYKIINWTGIWTNETTDTQITTLAACGGDSGCEKCITGGESTVPCPAQVQLPFFDYLELIISVVVIALIYISLVFRKKLKKKK
ncbi:Uncharacterised protein [uncultured archaeon]|nr:Uncharacterised protein [uncultured archaeon]